MQWGIYILLYLRLIVAQESLKGDVSKNQSRAPPGDSWSLEIDLSTSRESFKGDVSRNQSHVCLWWLWKLWQQFKWIGISDRIAIGRMFCLRKNSLYRPSIRTFLVFLFGIIILLKKPHSFSFICHSFQAIMTLCNILFLLLH